MQMISSGKVREIYQVDADTLLIKATDRISAFDVILPTLIPGKGIVLNKLSQFWFNYTRDIVKNHMITTDETQFPQEFQSPEFAERSMLVKKLAILPYEFIVRGYISGSAWNGYRKDGSFCGYRLPEGLRESDKLSEALFTPSTKEETGHDENISPEQLKDAIGVEMFTKTRDICIKLYDSCSRYAYEKGVILADTKFELGLDENGNIVLADELFTPDSSRFWSLADYKPGQSQMSFDKQFVRDWLIDNKLNAVEPAPELPDEIVRETQKKYAEALERLTGE